MRTCVNVYTYMQKSKFNLCMYLAFKDNIWIIALEYWMYIHVHENVLGRLL